MSDPEQEQQEQQQRSRPDELMVVMPAHNEQASVRRVVGEWVQEIGNWTENFRLLAIDDGSTDGTPETLRQLQQQLGADRLEIVTQRPNRGHGQSCLAGYRLAAARGVPWVFQVDSDGQCDPQYFFRFWRERERYDVLYGRRGRRRDDGLRRTFASAVVRLFLLVLFRVNCVDANVPYRLMRTAAVAPWLDRVPTDFSLANIALAVLLKKRTTLRHGDIPIRFRERYGGEPAVGFSKFGLKAAELYRQLRGMLRVN